MKMKLGRRSGAAALASEQHSSTAHAAAIAPGAVVKTRVII
jgi:hypothetical protein